MKYKVEMIVEIEESDEVIITEAIGDDIKSTLLDYADLEVISIKVEQE